MLCKVKLAVFSSEMVGREVHSALAAPPEHALVTHYGGMQHAKVCMRRTARLCAF